MDPIVQPIKTIINEAKQGAQDVGKELKELGSTIVKVGAVLAVLYVVLSARK